ncbi:MAG: DNA polymerase III subunit gamma/tau, partial [Candidatus Brocadiia bacterium]
LKYRPSKFDEVVGQKHVVTTLLNAIKSNHVAHAYLFCGSRGVGKTSAARIFAKTLNCPNVVDNVPCCKCDVCRLIADGTDLDVIEMDAASNRGIDDIRELRSNANFRPARSPFKIYIVDEVHMLTREAFNALLKTLEEPPDFVKFIFCTTEPERIPPTVLSRCQRFDFHRLTVEDIAAQLRRITEEEQHRISPEALSAVARYARGGLRDSIGLLEQLFVFSDQEITAADVSLALGAVSQERMRDMVFACARGDTGKAITELNAMLDAGRDSLELLDQMVDFLRDCIIATECPDHPDLLSGWLQPADLKTDEFAQLTPSRSLLMIGHLYWSRPFLKEDSSARVPLELAVVRMAASGEIFEIPAIIKALGRTGSAILNAEHRGELPPLKVSSPAQASPEIRVEPKLPGIPIKPVDTPVAPPQTQAKTGEIPGGPLDSLSALRDLWYSFVAACETSTFEKEALRKCQFQRKDGTMTLRLPSAGIAEKLSSRLDGFSAQAKASLGVDIGFEKPMPIAGIPDLDTIQAHPVVAQALDLFPGSVVESVKPQKKDQEEE